MSFNPLLIAQQIYAELAPCGITAVATCMTRLRVTINDKRKFDLAKLKAIT